MAGKNDKETQDIIINDVKRTTLQQFDCALEQQGWGARSRAEAIRYFIEAVATGKLNFKRDVIITAEK